MKAPQIPEILVYLGGAIEIDGDRHEWKWKKNENFVVATDELGKNLYLFQKPKRAKRASVNPSKKGAQTYQKFNRREPTKTNEIDVQNPKKKAGRCHHIAYRSTKFGACKSFIHVFDDPPSIWVDKIDKPQIIVLTGGNVHVTKRGIEG